MPVTEKSSEISSFTFTLESSWMVSVTVRWRVSLPTLLEAPSKTRPELSAMGIDARDGERERLRWCH